MHDDGCFTGCIGAILVFSFFFVLWGNIELNFHKRSLYLSKTSEVYTVKKIRDTIEKFDWFDDKKYNAHYVKVRYFTLNNSTEFYSPEKKFNLGDTIKRFYFINHKNEKIYSDYYRGSTKSYTYNTFWESTLFILYVLFFLLLTSIMYVKYFNYVKDQYNKRLGSLSKVNILDKIYSYLFLNKMIISISMISMFLLIFSLNSYFNDIPDVSINPANFILLSLIFTFLIPVIFIQILRNKEDPYYRNILNITRIFLIISSVFSLLFTLIELIKFGKFKETTVMKILSESWNILKDLLS